MPPRLVSVCATLRNAMSASGVPMRPSAKSASRITSGDSSPLRRVATGIASGRWRSPSRFPSTTVRTVAEASRIIRESGSSVVEVPILMRATATALRTRSSAWVASRARSGTARSISISPQSSAAFRTTYQTGWLRWWTTTSVPSVIRESATK